MIGLYIFVSLFVVSMATLIFYKVKWGREDWAVRRKQAVRIEEQRIKDGARLNKPKTQDLPYEYLARVL